MMRLLQKTPWQASTSPTSSRPSITGAPGSLRLTACRCLPRQGPWQRCMPCWCITVRQRLTNFPCRPRRWRPGWSGITRLSIRPVLPFVPPARVMPRAKGVVELLKRCRCGRTCARLKSETPGGASRWNRTPGGLTSTPNVRQKGRFLASISYKNSSCLCMLHKR